MPGWDGVPAALHKECQGWCQPTQDHGEHEVQQEWIHRFASCVARLITQVNYLALPVLTHSCLGGDSDPRGTGPVGGCGAICRNNRADALVPHLPPPSRCSGCPRPLRGAHPCCFVPQEDRGLPAPAAGLPLQAVLAVQEEAVLHQQSHPQLRPHPQGQGPQEPPEAGEQ